MQCPPLMNKGGGELPPKRLKGVGNLPINEKKGRGMNTAAPPLFRHCYIFTKISIMVN